MLDEAERVRFFAKIEKTDACWLWTAGRGSGPNGPLYGAFHRGGKVIGAHRVSWEEVHGPIPVGLEIDHLCFVPQCVNPDHMRLLTRSENARNQRSAFSMFCIHGHEYTPENTIVLTRKGKRNCRECKNTRARRAWAARRAAA